MEQEKENTSTKLTVSRKELFMYAFGSMFCTGPNQNFINYLFLFFMTDIAGISTVVAASVYTICDVLKSIHAQLSGVLIDYVDLKWGKYRSWFIICLFVTAAFSGAIFLPYRFENEIVYAVVLVVLFTIATFSYNLNWTAHRSLVGLMSRNSTDNVTFVSWSWAAAMASGLLYGTCNSVILEKFSFAGKYQYALVEYLWVILVIIGSTMLINLSKKYDIPGRYTKVQNKASANKGERVGLLEMLKTLTGPGLAFFSTGIIANVQSGFFYALLAYYTTYVLNDPAAMGYAVIVNYVGGMIGSMITPTITKNWTRKRTYITGLSCQCVCYCLMFFFGNTATGFLAIRLLIGIFNSAAGGISSPAITNDLADYYEMKGSSRARGFIQALNGTAIQVGKLVSSAISSFGLAIIGYDASQPITDTMIQSISIMMVVGPAVVTLLASLVLGFFYNLDEKAIAEYRASRVAMLTGEDNV